MTIKDGGVVSNNYATIANSAGSSGSVLVTGNGSNWSNLTVTVGNQGSGTLTIADGGKMTTRYEGVGASDTIGNSPGSQGTVTVVGTGSAWSNTSKILVGNRGTGILNILDGGMVSNCGIAVGSWSDTDASVSVSGSDSLLSVASLAGQGGVIDIYGNGELTISNGGAAISDGAHIGLTHQAQGNATITGNGSKWTSKGWLYVGYLGAGVLEVSNGGIVMSKGLYLGVDANGTVIVDGNGSRLNVTDGLSVNGSSEFAIVNGASAQVLGDTSVAYHSGGSIRFDHTTLETGGLIASFDGLAGTGTINTHGLISDFDLVFDATHGLQRQFVLTNSPDQNITVNLDANGNGSMGAGGGGNSSLTIKDGVTVKSTNGYLGALQGSHGRATISGAGSAWINSGLLSVGEYGTGDLTITDGALVSASTSEVGYFDDGTVLVTGLGSLWSTTGELRVGSTSGSGRVAVEAGAKITSDQANDFSGSIIVNGAGSTWTVNKSLLIGGWGGGHLRIDDGGVVNDAGAYLGTVNGPGYATVLGPNSVWRNYTLMVGDYGSGELIVSDTGQVISENSHIGEGRTTNGKVNVSGAGSIWSSGTLSVAYSGTGTLSIAEGGAVSSSSAQIGQDYPGDGSVNVSGAGSAWTITNDVRVGINGKGRITIANGGTVSSATGIVGDASNGVGLVEVIGSSSKWANTGSLVIALNGTGTLAITDGGSVEAGETFVGRLGKDGKIQFDGGGLSTRTLFAAANALKGKGTIDASGLVSDINLVFDDSHRAQQQIILRNDPEQDVTINLDASSTGSLGVGYSGNGSLTVARGGQVSSQNGFLGYRTGSTGTATVTDASSAWRIAGSLYVGGSDTQSGGTGSLTVNNGGLTSVGNSLKVWSKGVVRQEAEALLVVSSDLEMPLGVTGTVVGGGHGGGTLSLTAGAALFSSNGRIGLGPGSTGSATVTGSNAVWNNSIELNVGESGTGALSITNGGRVTSALAFVGKEAGAKGTVTLSGTNSTWTNSGNLYVGGDESGSGAGVLTVSSAAALNVGDTLTVENGGTLILDGASIATRNFDNRGVFTFQSGSLSVNGGTFSPRSTLGDVTIDSRSPFDPVNVNLSGGAKSQNIAKLIVGDRYRVNLQIADGAKLQSTSGYIGQSPSSRNSVTITGAGSAWSITENLNIGWNIGPSVTPLSIGPGATLTVGGETIAQSVVKLDGGTFASNSIRFQGGQFNWTSGKLQVGTYNASLVNTNGVLAPGPSIGNSKVVGNYTQQSNAALAIDLSGTDAGLYDTLNVTGTASLAGWLDLSLLGGFAPQIGQQFSIITAGSVINNGLAIRGAAANAFTLTVNSTSVVLQVTRDLVPGDYNFDVVVDASDFVLWRKMDGSQQGYEAWRVAFGQTAENNQSIHGDPAAVPEPAAGGIMRLVFAAAAVLRRRKTRQPD